MGTVKVSKMSKMHEPPHAYILILFKFRLSRSALLAKNLHLFEVKEVRVIRRLARQELKEVSDVCFVRQMVIYMPHGGIVFNSERSDNYNNF